MHKIPDVRDLPSMCVAGELTLSWDPGTALGGYIIFYPPGTGINIDKYID